jgi:hypothetical protein
VEEPKGTAASVPATTGSPIVADGAPAVAEADIATATTSAQPGPDTETPTPATPEVPAPGVAPVVSEGFNVVEVATPPLPATPPVSTPAVRQAAVAPPTPSTVAGRVPTGPGGGKRRKPRQADAPVAPDWVDVPAPRQGSFLGGPAVWGVIAIIAVLLAGTVLSNGAFTPFPVETVDVATNTFANDTVRIGPGRVQTTSITVGDLTPGTTVVRAPFSVQAESSRTGKAIAAYVSLVSEKPATHLRAVILRCLDVGGAPAPCGSAVGFADARLDIGGAPPLMVETTGGAPSAATVRATSGADLEILEGAGNVKKGGKVRGAVPVARPTQGATATLTDFFVVGGTVGGLGHGAQDVGVSGATATLPMVKGIPGLPPDGQAYLLGYFYAVPDTPSADATAKVGVTVAVLAISADPTP